MTTKYTFIAVSNNGKQETMVTETTECETWGAPMELFFRFLKGTGYYFNTNEELCILNTDTGETRGAGDLLA